jgi:hypothetical protein
VDQQARGYQQAGDHQGGVSSRFSARGGQLAAKAGGLPQDPAGDSVEAGG